MHLNILEIHPSPLQVLPDVPRLSVFSGGEAAGASGGGGAPTGSGGSLQGGPTLQPADLHLTPRSGGKP